MSPINEHKMYRPSVDRSTFRSKNDSLTLDKPDKSLSEFKKGEKYHGMKKNPPIDETIMQKQANTQLKPVKTTFDKMTPRKMSPMVTTSQIN